MNYMQMGHTQIACFLMGEDDHKPWTFGVNEIVIYPCVQILTPNQVFFSQICRNLEHMTL